MPDPRHRAVERSRRMSGGAAAIVASLVLTIAFVAWQLGDPTSGSVDEGDSGKAVAAAARAGIGLSGNPVRFPWTGRKSRPTMVGKGRTRTLRLATPVSRADADSLARGAQEWERRERIRLRKRAEWRAQHAPFTVHIATFNVLGSQHSMPGGSHAGYPSAGVRSARAVGYIERHGADIVGTQELQPDQLRALQAGTGMAAYPGYGWGIQETDNSILYDDSKYEFVSGDTYYVYFVSRMRPQPILRLRDRDTGREFYVVNTHTTPGQGAAAGHRYRAHATTSAMVRKLRADTGLPVLLTGDMNDRAPFFCQVVATAAMTTPQGGSYGGGCAPPGGHLAVDWVAGAGIDHWSDYWMDTSSVANRTSDHFVVSAVAHVG